MSTKWKVGDAAVLLTSKRQHSGVHESRGVLTLDDVTVTRVGRVYLDVRDTDGHSRRVIIEPSVLETRSPHSPVTSVHRTEDAAHAAVRTFRRAALLEQALRGLSGARAEKLRNPEIADCIARLLDIELGDGVAP